MIKEIIFDCFGVLTQDGWTAFTKKYATPETADDLHAVNAVADKGIIGYPEFLKQVSEITGAPEATAHQIITSSLHPNEEIFALAHALKRNYNLGIISNVGSPLRDYFPSGYLDDFVVQTLSFEVGIIKPSAEIFTLHLQRSGVDAAEAVFIDDRLSNCEAARNVGLHAIHFQTLDLLSSELLKLGIKI